MSGTGGVVLTLLVGVLGGVTARRLRMPGGAILGSLLAVAGLHLLLEELEPLGPGFRTAAQIAIGGVIGSTLTRSPLRAVLAIGKQALLVLVILIGVSIGLALALTELTTFSLETSLFALAPGGASDMTSAALTLDANVGVIAAVHVVRQIVVFGIVSAAFAHFMTPLESARPTPLRSQGDPQMNRSRRRWRRDRRR